MAIQVSIEEMTPEDISIFRASYNPHNKLITIPDIQNILEKAGLPDIAINNIALWQMGFIHSSYSVNTKKNYSYTYLQKNLKLKAEQEGHSPPEVLDIPEDIKNMPLEQMYPRMFKSSFETVEMLGDAIIQSISTLYLFHRLRNVNQGDLTTYRSRLVRAETLAKISTHLGLDKHLIMSRAVENLYSGRMSKKVLCDVFESVIGSLMLDAPNEIIGYDRCRKFFISVVEKYIDISLFIRISINFKHRLMVYFQTHYDGAFPTYQTEREELQEDGKKMFYLMVRDKVSNKVGRAYNTKKQQAEQLAALDLMLKLNLIEEDELEELHNEGFL